VAREIVGKEMKISKRKGMQGDVRRDITIRDGKGIKYED
jgi:hypothetical protein